VSIDPGYGRADAPVGSEDWAKRWRLGFQSAALDLPGAPKECLIYYHAGLKHRAWSLLTNEYGEPFDDFDTFCACKQPYGLGTNPAKFRAYLEAEEGKRAVELLTVSVGDDVGGRPKNGETADTVSAVSPGEQRKSERLRAILRAPEIVQDLYREGKVSQTTAAKLGPKKPTPEQAAKVAEARQEIERLNLACEPKRVRKEVDEVVRRVLGQQTPTLLDQAKRAVLKLTAQERAELTTWLTGLQP